MATARPPPSAWATTGWTTSAAPSAPTASVAAAESAASAFGTLDIRCRTSARMPANANGQNDR